MTTTIAHWVEGRRLQLDIVRMIGMGMKKFARAAWTGRTPKTVADLNPALLRDMGLQAGPVTITPADGGADRAADPASPADRRRAFRLIRGTASRQATAIAFGAAAPIRNAA